MADGNVIGRIKLNRVRASFFHGYEPQPGKVDKKTGVKSEDRYGMSCLMDKNTAQGQANIALAKAGLKEVMRAKYGDDPKKHPKIKAEHLCVRDGDNENYDGYEGMMYLSMGARISDPPRLIDRRKGTDGKWIDSPPGQIYSGCYVNVVGRLWVQDNEHGRKINCQMEAVQFCEKGDAFGASRVDVDEAFGDDDIGEVSDISGDDDDLLG